MPVLYKNDANPWIEQFSIIGRYQGQYFATDSNAGEDEDYATLTSGTRDFRGWTWLGGVRVYF